VIILKKKIAGFSEGALNRFIARATAAAGIRGKVNVLVTDNRELQSLNLRFRKKDTPTDVLSFPADGEPRNEIAGDVAISAEMAAENGTKLGHSVIEEVKILILHGVLHLAGYDHERDNGRMARKEAQLRRAFKLPVGLIERHDLSTRTKAKALKKSPTAR